MIPIAHFVCLRCTYRYSSLRGGTQCPMCGSLYVFWLDPPGGR